MTTYTQQELRAILEEHRKWQERDGGSCANLSGANLMFANFGGANLSGANFGGANLSGANLSGANLSGALDAELVWALTVVAPEGGIVGWKKAKTKDGDNCIVKLLIPAQARRSNATGRKCRAEWAEVIEIIGASEAISSRDESFIYRVGETVRPDSWDENRWEECSHGIHFFITRKEAEAYQL